MIFTLWLTVLGKWATQPPVTPSKSLWLPVQGLDLQSWPWMASQTVTRRSDCVAHFDSNGQQRSLQSGIRHTNASRTGCYLLNIWEFVYFVWGLSPPKRRVVRWRNFAGTRVPTMCRTCAGFCVYRGRRYENNIFPKMRCGDLRSVGATAGSRLAGCSSAVARYSDVAGVSQSDWPLRVY